MKISAKFGVIALMSMTYATAASAVATIFSSLGIDSPRAVNEVLVCDFDTTCADKLSGNFGIVQGSSANWTAPQLLNASNYWVTPGTGAGGASTLDLSWLGPLKSFSFEWGSINADDTVLISLASGFNFTFTGSNIIFSGFGDQSSPNANRIVFVDFDAPETVNSFTAISTDGAFEVDNFAAAGAVPELATWTLLIVGFGLTGVAMRRRQMTSVTG